MSELKADTRFSGKCPSCGRWCTYRPLPGGYAPRLPVMRGTCSKCDEPVEMGADQGQNPRQPLVLDRGELDLSQLRAHCREHHANRKLPRSNRDLASWHWNQHHRYSPAHTHFGPFVLVRDRYGRTLGQISCGLGWYTGQDVKTSEQLTAEWAAKHPKGS